LNRLLNVTDANHAYGLNRRQATGDERSGAQLAR